MRARLGGAALVCALVLGMVDAEPAHASNVGLGIDGPEGAEIMAAVLLADTAFVFLTLDVIYFALDRPMPQWLSVLEVLVGAAFAPIIAIAAARSAPLVIGALACIAWFGAHGMYQHAAYPDWKREQEEKQWARRGRAELFAIASNSGLQG